MAGLLDEVDRARTWQPKTPEGVDGKSGIATVSNERLRPLANGGPTSSRFSFPYDTGVPSFAASIYFLTNGRSDGRTMEQIGWPLSYEMIGRIAEEIMSKRDGTN